MNDLHMRVRRAVLAISVGLITTVSTYAHAQECSWNTVPGRAKSVGTNGSNTWVIGCNDSTNCNDQSNQAIYRFNQTVLPNTFAPEPGLAYRITVSTDGVPWVINEAGHVFKWNGVNNWTPIPANGSACAGSIAVGHGDDAWVTGCGTGDQPIYNWNGVSWVLQTGPLAQTGYNIGILNALNGTQQPFVLKSSGFNNIFVSNGSSWSEALGSAKWASENSVLETDGNIYEWAASSGTFNEVDSPAPSMTQFAGDPLVASDIDILWSVNSSGTISNFSCVFVPR
jgi:hypothetical protein